jgi:hypothetical protein
MKPSQCFRSAAVIALVLFSGCVGASLTVRDLNAPGDGLLTYDPVTGLEWLDLTLTEGKSRESVAAGWGGYTTTMGFQVATREQVHQFATDAGIVLNPDGSPENFEPARNFQLLVGVTGTYPGDPLPPTVYWTFGFVEQWPENPNLMNGWSAFYVVVGQGIASAGEMSLSPFGGPNGSGGANGHPDYGTFLVRQASALLAVTKGGAGSGTVTSNPSGIECGSDCSKSYASTVPVTLTATPAPGSVFMGWLGACIGTGPCNVNVSTATSVPAASVSATFAPDTVLPRIDIDGNNGYDALTDGLLMIRYLFGLTGTALTNGALDGAATRTDPAAIKERLDNTRPLLDIDGSGQPDALTDGLLMIRYLFGLRGDALIAGALDPLATRKTALDIEAYLQTLMP